jgi:glyceraldehyde 3-phosphate dehydrogenase
MGGLAWLMLKLIGVSCFEEEVWLRRIRLSAATSAGVKSGGDKMSIRIAINGFGRTGRMFYRAAFEKNTPFEVVAVNDVTSTENLAHLLKYDSVHGRLSKQVKVEGAHIIADGHRFEVLSEHDPSKLPWSKLGVRVVIEASGHFTSREKAAVPERKRL